MKKLNYLLGAAVMITTFSCSSTYKAGNNATDDVYYSSKNQNPSSTPSPEIYNTENSVNYQNDNSSQPQQQQPDYAPDNNYTTTEQTSDGNGNTYITNNYNGNYYDYEYSSRIRRFYEPAYGYNYYDPYYTNSYWYDYNPYSWGVSIYLGYNWWAPSSFYYSPFCYGGLSVGFGYGSCGYYPYYPTPYYGYGYPYYPYYNYGYNSGYYCGNPNPYYYNSYDNNSTYYGPRGSVSSNSVRSSSQRQSTLAPVSTNYEKAISDGRIARPQNSLRKSDIQNQEKNIYQENKNPLDPGYQFNKNQPSSDKVKVENGNVKDLKNNSTIKPVVNPSNTSGKDNQIKNTGKSNQPNSGLIDTKQEIKSVNENKTGTRSTVQDPKQGDAKINNDRDEKKNVVPPVNTDYNKKDNNNRNTEFAPKENRETKFDNKRLQNAVSPKNDNSSDKDEIRKSKKESNYDIPSRNENRSPVFQPRNEPKQYKQESSPSPQRSQPSQNNNSGGGRKR